MRLWKVLGLAGLAGVAATGAIIARDQRQRAQLDPDDVRKRLHERFREAAAHPVGDAVPVRAREPRRLVLPRRSARRR